MVPNFWTHKNKGKEEKSHNLQQKFQVKYSNIWKNIVQYTI